MSTAFLESDSAIDGSFFLRLPRAGQPAAAPLRSSRRPGILVVDDEPVTRILLSAGLRQEGIAVWMARHGRKALALYERHAEEIDLVLLSVSLPGLDGPQTMAILRQLNPGVCCCFMSGPTDAYTEEELLQRGAEVVVPRTYRSDKVTHTLWRLLRPLSAGSRRMPGGLAARSG